MDCKTNQLEFTPQSFRVHNLNRYKVNELWSIGGKIHTRNMLLGIFISLEIPTMITNGTHFILSVTNVVVTCYRKSQQV